MTKNTHFVVSSGKSLSKRIPLPPTINPGNEKDLVSRDVTSLLFKMSNFNNNNNKNMRPAKK